MDRHESTSPSYLCRHEVRYHGRVGVVACADCGCLEFHGARGLLDPAEGVAALFGSFDLVGKVPAIAAPADHVLAYRPPLGKRSALDVLPTGVWLRVHDELWLASDRQALLLATPNRLMVDNLTRGA